MAHDVPTGLDGPGLPRTGRKKPAMKDQDWSSVAKKAFAERDEAKRKLKEANEKISSYNKSMKASLRKAMEDGKFDEAWVDPEKIAYAFTNIKSRAEARAKFVTKIACPAPVIEGMRNCGASLFQESTEREKRTLGIVGIFMDVCIHLDNNLTSTKDEGSDTGHLVRYFMEDMGSAVACEDDLKPREEQANDSYVGGPGYPDCERDSIRKKVQEVLFNAFGMLGVRTARSEPGRKWRLSGQEKYKIFATAITMEEPMPRGPADCIGSRRKDEVGDKAMAAARAILREVFKHCVLPEGVGEVRIRQVATDGVDRTGAKYEIDITVYLLEAELVLPAISPEAYMTALSGEKAFCPGSICPECESSNLELENDSAFPKGYDGYDGLAQSQAKWKCGACKARGLIRLTLETTRRGQGEKNCSNSAG